MLQQAAGGQASHEKPGFGSLLRASAARELSTAGLLAIAAVLAAAAAGASAAALAAAVAVWLGINLYALAGLARHAPHARFGTANRITLLRGLATSAFAGAAAVAADLAAPALWLLALAGGGALVLDGVDGRLARRQGTASPFGAAFDMAVDALTILCLSLLVWRLDRAGAWVLLIGTLRYAFLAAGRMWPALRRPLPPRRRRQAICVLQIAALVAVLPPLLPPVVQTAVLATALAALVLSFAIDVAEGLRRR